MITRKLAHRSLSSSPFARLIQEPAEIASDEFLFPSHDQVWSSTVRIVQRWQNCSCWALYTAGYSCRWTRIAAVLIRSTANYGEKARHHSQNRAAGEHYVNAIRWPGDMGNYIYACQVLKIAYVSHKGLRGIYCFLVACLLKPSREFHRRTQRTYTDN